MTAWVYSVMRNESTLIGYWLRHYATFCERIVIYDDHSDDGTPEMARGLAEVRQYPGHGLDDTAFINLANDQYREARGHADWVIWVDGDEFLYHPRMTERLAELKAEGANLPMVDGWNMVAEAPPVGQGQIYDEITTGFRDRRYSKPVLVSPWLDIEWTVGRHEIVVTGNVVRGTGDPLRLLHYRYLGSAYHQARARRNWAWLSDLNRRAGLTWEARPGWQGAYSTRWYEEQRQLAEVCV